MQSDGLLRERVRRSVEGFDPDANEVLGSVSRRGRRRRVVHRAKQVGAVAVIAAIVLFAGPRILDVAQRARPAHQPETPQGIAGAYRARIVPTPGVVSRVGMVGIWTMEPTADGSLRLSAPAGFVGDTSG